jgi:hypothetical protein
MIEPRPYKITVMAMPQVSRTTIYQNRQQLVSFHLAKLHIMGAAARWDAEPRDCNEKNRAIAFVGCRFHSGQS